MKKDELLSNLKLMFQSLHKELSTIQYKPNNVKERLAIAYCSRMLEAYAASIHLIQADIISQFPIIVRSQFESLIDLELVINNPRATKYLLAEVYRVQEEYCTRIIDVAPTLDGHPDPKERRKALKKKLSELEREGIKPRSWTSKISRSNLPDQLKWICKMCSCAVHNNLLELIKRNIDNSDKTSVIIFKDIDIKSLRVYIVSLCDTMIIAFNMLHELLELSRSDEFIKATETYRQLGEKFDEMGPI